MLGLIIAAPGLLPNLWGLLQSDRLSATRRIPLIYFCKYCTRFLPALLCHDGENYLYVAVSAVSLIAAFTMFVLGVKKYLPVVYSLLILICFSMIPAVGSLFNDLNYATNLLECRGSSSASLRSAPSPGGRGAPAPVRNSTAVRLSISS